MGNDNFSKSLSFFSIKTTVHNTTVDSHLYLASATASDSGIYSCNVAQVASARLSLHILNGKSHLGNFANSYLTWRRGQL